MQGALGRPDLGLAGAEMAYRLNPLNPSWYNYYGSRGCSSFQEAIATPHFSWNRERSIRPTENGGTCMAWRAATRI